MNVINCARGILARFWPPSKKSGLVTTHQKLPGIHGLRALAALMIVLFHLHGILSLAVPPALGLVASHFGLGVTLFFVISAFSLSYSNPNAINDLPNYYTKRLFRIFPLFYFMFCVYGILFAWPSLFSTIAQLAFIFNFIPGGHESSVWAGWTIGVEMIFYVVLPILIALCVSFRAILVGVILTALIGYSARVLLTDALPTFPGYSGMSFIGNLPIFFAGIAAYWAYARWKDSSSAMPAAVAFVVMGGLVVFLLHPISIGLVTRGRPDSLFWGYAFAAMCLWQALSPSRIFACAAAQWIGERSFSVYLLHPLVIYSMRDIHGWIYSVLTPIGAWAFVVCAVVTLPILLGLSAVTYRFIELPGVTMGRHLARRKAASAAVAS